jgi:hypothetical protein
LRHPGDGLDRDVDDFGFRISDFGLPLSHGTACKPPGRAWGLDSRRLARVGVPQGRDEEAQAEGP